MATRGLEQDRAVSALIILIMRHRRTVRSCCTSRPLRLLVRYQQEPVTGYLPSDRRLRQLQRPQQQPLPPTAPSNPSGPDTIRTTRTIVTTTRPIRWP